MRGTCSPAPVRRYALSWSSGGFALRVSDHVRWRYLVAGAVEGVLSCIGHPCCFRGVGRVPGFPRIG